MRAGNLDRTITLQRATTVNETGTDVTTWTDLATVRAELLPPVPAIIATAPTVFSAAETDRAFGEIEETILVFRIRWRPYDLTTADRVLYAGTAYELTGITEIGRRVGLELRCRSRT